MPFISYENRRILFVHIPKTGGTTVEKWMDGLGPVRLRTVGVPDALKITPQHFTASDIFTLFGDDYFDYGFTVVRNPYARIASEYKMQAILARNGFWRAEVSFANWLETAITHYKKYNYHLDNHMRPQWHFLSNKVKVFKFEDGLENAVDDVISHNDLPARSEKLPKLVNSKIFDGTIDWDIREVGLVQELYQKDFEVLGYDPDDVPVS